MTTLANPFGNPAAGAPTITPPDQQNFQITPPPALSAPVPTIGADQSQYNTALQGQQTAAKGLQATAAGQGPNAAALETQQGVQSATEQSLGALNSAGAAGSPGAAARAQQGAQASGASKAIGAGATAAANQQVQAQQALGNLQTQMAQGTLQAASQRTQADIAQQNLFQQQVKNQMALAQQQMQGAMSFAAMSQQYKQQQYTNAYTAGIQAQKNMQTLFSTVLQAGGAAAGAAMRGGSTSADPVDPNAGPAAPGFGPQGDTGNEAVADTGMENA